MKRKNNKTKLVLLILLICITLGYAALRTGLNINGTANVTGSSWSVYFDNYQNSNNTNITPTTEPTITGTTTTSISYEVDLEQPGDLYEFTVDIVNGGSLDALISLTSKLGGNEIDSNNPVPSYIIYSVTDGSGNAIENNHRLNHSSSETVKVYVKYRDDDPSVLPNSNANLSFDLEIVAEQAPKASPTPVETGNFVVSTTGMSIGQTIPQGVNIRSTPALAMADWQDILDEPGATRSFYLKHILNGSDEIEESYVGFVITDALKTQLKEEYCSGDSTCEAKYDALVNGTYYLRGGVDESSLEEGNQPIYEANTATIKQAYGTLENDSNVCSFGSSSSGCDLSGLDAYAYSNGDVLADDDDDANCHVSSDGSSDCDE